MSKVKMVIGSAILISAPATWSAAAVVGAGALLVAGVGYAAKNISHQQRSSGRRLAHKSSKLLKYFK